MNYRAWQTAYAFLGLGACSPDLVRPTAFDFYAEDHSNGIFFDHTEISFGSVIYIDRKPVEKGVEEKVAIIKFESLTATCIVAGNFIMALPKARGLRIGKAQCESVWFKITPCRKEICSGYQVQLSKSPDPHERPLSYSYVPERGVTKISFDPRGLAFYPMILAGEYGPKATGEYPR